MSLPLSAKIRELPSVSVIVPVPPMFALLAPWTRKSALPPTVIAPLLISDPAKYEVWPPLVLIVPALVIAPLVEPSRKAPFARTTCPPDAVDKVPPRNVALPNDTVPPLIALIVPRLASTPPLNVMLPLSARITLPLVPPLLTVSDEPPVTSNVASAFGAAALKASVLIASLPTSCVMVFMPVTTIVTSLFESGSPSGDQLIGSDQLPLMSIAQLIGAASAPMEASASARAVRWNDEDANAMESPGTWMEHPANRAQRYLWRRA